MDMAASVVTYTVDPNQADELRKQISEHLVPAAQLIDGYRGFMLLDMGENKRMAILLFDSVAAVQAAQQTLSPIGRDHTYALMTSPALGALGRAVVADGIFAE